MQRVASMKNAMFAGTGIRGFGCWFIVYGLWFADYSLVLRINLTQTKDYKPPPINYPPPFLIRTAQTLYSGILEIGSCAEIVSWLALFAPAQ